MAQDETDRPDRRCVPPGRSACHGLGPELWHRPRRQPKMPPPSASDAPKRKLGKTGLEITMLEMGTGALREQGVLERLLRLSYASGVRTFDTAKAYGTEPGFKKWFERSPEVRKEIVLVTKDNPRAPKDMMLGCSTSGWRPCRPTMSTCSSSTAWATTTSSTTPSTSSRSQEFKETADAIRKSGKAKFVGFSTHHKDRAADHPGGGRRGHHRRDHAPVHPLARQGRAAQQGP